MKRESRDPLAPILERASCRSFRPDPVPERDVEKMLEAMIRAPSAGNMQPWRFYIVRAQQIRQSLAAAAFDQGFVAEAAIVFVVCADPARSAREYGSRGRSLYVIQDTAAATIHLLIAATALGYGSCWVGAFDEDQVGRILGLSGGLRPVAIVPVGAPSRPSRLTERRPRDEVVVYR